MTDSVLRQIGVALIATAAVGLLAAPAVLVGYPAVGAVLAVAGVVSMTVGGLAVHASSQHRSKAHGVVA